MPNAEQSWIKLFLKPLLLMLLGSLLWLRCMGRGWWLRIWNLYPRIIGRNTTVIDFLTYLKWAKFLLLMSLDFLLKRYENLPNSFLMLIWIDWIFKEIWNSKIFAKIISATEVEWFLCCALSSITILH